MIPTMPITDSITQVGNPVEVDLIVSLANGEKYQKTTHIQPYLVNRLENGEELQLIDIKTKKRGKITIFVKATRIIHGFKMGIVPITHITLELVETREDLSVKEI